MESLSEEKLVMPFRRGSLGFGVAIRCLFYIMEIDHLTKGVKTKGVKIFGTKIPCVPHILTGPGAF